MSKRLKEPPRGPIIQILLDKTTHCKQKIRIALDSTIIYHLVADLIRRKINESDKTNAII